MDNIKERFKEFYLRFKNENKIEFGQLEEYRLSAIAERKKRNILIWIIEIIAILLIIYGVVIGGDYEENVPAMGGFTLSFLGPLCIAFVMPKKMGEYEKRYKDIVIRKLIKTFGKSLEYYPDSTIEYNEYKEIGLEHCNEFYSKDVIRGKNLNNEEIIISKIITQYTYIGSQATGGMGSYETFEGLFARNKNIKLDSNRIIIIKGKNEFSKKIFETFGNIFVKDFNQVISTKEKEKQLSKEYEKLDIDKLSNNFIIYTSNLENRNIFDDKLIEDLIKISNEHKFDLTIKNDNIYIKLWIDGGFSAPPLEKNVLDEEIIYKNFKMLYTTFYLLAELKKRLI